MKWIVFVSLVVGSLLLQSAFSNEWGECVREKKLEYIDEGREDWREYESRAISYCNIKVEQEGVKNEKNRQEKERERQLIEENEKQKKESEKNFGGAKKDRTLELRVGEPIFLDNYLLGIGTISVGLRVEQSITVFSANEDVRRATVSCTATALIQKEIWGGVMGRARYVEIKGFQNVIFGIGKTKSTSEIGWRTEPGIVSIKDFKYTCDVTQGSRPS